MINETTIQQVNYSARIEDVTAQLSLKKTGSNLKGCCPFHQEKTPSFVVSPAKNMYKCFGCGRGGGPVAFLMETGKSFPEAIKALASMYSIEVEYTGEKGDQAADDHTAAIMVALDLTAAHFAQVEKNPSVKYWTDRGFTEQTLDTFGVGYCDGTKPAHITDEVMNAGGLLSEKGNLSMYKRTTFPIHDRLGRVVSFAGRVLEGDKAPKYINGPDTEVYKKSDTIYNLHRAAPFIRQRQEVWIVEGYADCMALWQMGFWNVVAISGLYLSENQLAMLKKFNGDKPLTVYLCIDNQVYGTGAKQEVKKAFEKALFSLSEFAAVKTVEYPKNAKDAADILKLGLNIKDLNQHDAITQWAHYAFESDFVKKASPVEIAERQDQLARLLSKINKQNVLDIYITNLSQQAMINVRRLEELVKNHRTRQHQEIENKKYSEFPYIKVLDDYYQRSIDYNVISKTTNIIYQRRKATELRFEGVSLQNLPRFNNWIIVPDHLNYKRVIEVNHEGNTFRFFNSYNPLPYKPEPFDLPAEFMREPAEYDYEKIAEIKNTAAFIKHLAGFEKYGNRYVTILWDWLALTYLQPTQRLPALALVSSEEGTGKSTFIQLCLNIFGQNATKTDANRIGANFNAQMAGKVLICVEETKDEKGDIENKLKDLITSFEKVVEPKHQDARVVQSFDKFIFASNHPEGFMKVGTATTRFFVLQVPQIKKKVHDFEQVLYREIPYLLFFLQKRQVLTPKTDRLWFDPKLLENEALLRLRQASKDIVQQNMEELFQNIFLRCEYTEPCIRMNAEYLTRLMQTYGGKMYDMKTPNYFSKVATNDMRLYQAQNPAKFQLFYLKSLHESGFITAPMWTYEVQPSSGRYIEFPIWKFVTAIDVVANFTVEQISTLYDKLNNPKLAERYGDVPAQYRENLLTALLAAKKAPEQEE